MNEPIKCYLSHPHACGYLPGKQATSLIIDPSQALNRALYTRLAQLGFRRSGEQTYQPQCSDCAACIPLRVAVNDFAPNRSQRRIWKRNQDISISTTEARFEPQHFDLYRRYLHSQHKDGGMDSEASPANYLAFLTCRGLQTSFIEFRQQTVLIAVAVVDHLDNALSAVYTFYDPVARRRSPGTFAILWQIEQTRRLGLDWLYLGYWIRECRKMNYKDAFEPCEILCQGQWQRLNKA